jgi:hypothetical protein
MMFLFLDLVGAQQLQYRLSVPDGWDHWVLLDDPGAAWGCYAHAADSETKSYIDDSERSEHLATYKSGAIAVVIGDRSRAIPTTAGSSHTKSELSLVSREAKRVGFPPSW